MKQNKNGTHCSGVIKNLKKNSGLLMGFETHGPVILLKCSTELWSQLEAGHLWFVFHLHFTYFISLDRYLLIFWNENWQCHTSCMIDSLMYPSTVGGCVGLFSKRIPWFSGPYGRVSDVCIINNCYCRHMLYTQVFKRVPVDNSENFKHWWTLLCSVSKMH